MQLVVLCALNVSWLSHSLMRGPRESERAHGTNLTIFGVHQMRDTRRRRRRRESRTSHGANLIHDQRGHDTSGGNGQAGLSSFGTQQRSQTARRASGQCARCQSSICRQEREAIGQLCVSASMCPARCCDTRAGNCILVLSSLFALILVAQGHRHAHARAPLPPPEYHSRALPSTRQRN